MNYLFFTNTPAHVHLYKNTIRSLEETQHSTLALARDYGCTKELLDYEDVEYELYGGCGTAKFSLARNLPTHFTNIFRKARSYDPDLIFGMGAYSAFAGAVTRTPVVSILDSEPTSLDHTVSKPFTNIFLTPHAFQKDLGNNHYYFRGFKETAYLHPDIYEPGTENIHDELGVSGDPYVILRFNAFGSHHDVAHAGFSRGQKEQLIDELSQYATVFVSDESDILDFSTVDGQKFHLHPALMHDALANASLLVADTQTIVTEAAFLGTPAIRSNSFVGESDMGNFKNLEENSLIFNLAEFDNVLEQAREILEEPSIQNEWRSRRNEYLSDKVNLTEVILDITKRFAAADRNGVEKIIRDHEDVVQ
ncbi:DUF354 domain-containing protein [Halovenus salina]|uniref:DUF354 domain-containing protein n=1 Tax=Halovenus salina TaxID=1510225 RepID=UPI002260F8D9|nr:DUF354 domain-containing protein [Halovenus salina]